MACLSAYIANNKKQTATTTIEIKKVATAVIEKKVMDTNTINKNEKMMDPDAINKKKSDGYQCHQRGKRNKG